MDSIDRREIGSGGEAGAWIGARECTRRFAWLVPLVVACGIAFPQAAGATPTFLSAINLSASGQDGFEPEVAVDSSGNELIVWTRSDGSNFRIQAMTRDPNGAIGPTQTISDPGQNASEPQVAFDPSGNAIAVWSRSDGAHTRVQSAYRPVNGSFGSAQTLSDSGADADKPQISIDSGGEGVAVWERTDSGKFRIQSAVAPSGGNFGAPQTLSDPGQDADRPQVSAGADADNQTAVVWSRFDGTNLRVQSSRRRDVPGYPRPKGATPLRASLVPAYTACTSPNRQHGAPLSSSSCNPPIQSSSVLTVGTLDANGFTANSVASVRFDTVVGNPNNSINDADVRVAVSMTDIRNNPSGTDYTGRVLLSVPIQITDKNNAAETPEPATSASVPLEMPVDCTATVDTTIGSKCSLSTTVNSLLPNAVVENMRTIWEFGQVQVKDAGPNGTGYGAGCPPACGDGDEAVFMRQGVFVP